MDRKYYAAYSYMGTDFTFGSPCWTVYRFDNAWDRAAWIRENWFKDGRRVAQAVTRKEAEQIVGHNFVVSRDYIGEGIVKLERA